MNKPDKNNYYKLFSNVIVGYSSGGSTLCKRCHKDYEEFAVYLGDDRRMSTMWGYCCSKCLPLLVKDANDRGNENVENYYNRDCKKYYEECVQYVRKTKLDNLGNIIEE